MGTRKQKTDEKGMGTKIDKNPVFKGSDESTNGNPNPGNGEYMPKSGEGNSQSERNAKDKWSTARQDPAWAQLNPSEFIEAFGPGIFDTTVVKKGAKYPWNMGYLQSVLQDVIDDVDVTVPYSYEDSADREPVFMVFDYWPSIGHTVFDDIKGTTKQVQPQIEIGKLLYQAISARKRSALPVDALSISAYMIALQSVFMMASVVRRVLKLCSIVSVSSYNVALDAKSMLVAMGFSESAVDSMIAPLDGSDMSWMDGVTVYNRLVGEINQLMSPPDLPLYRRMWFLNDHIFKEIDNDDKGVFYIFRPTWFYTIDWVGDPNGTTLSPTEVHYDTLETLMQDFRDAVNAITGYNIGSDDANNVQAGLKYVFEDRVQIPLWDWVTYTTPEGKTVTSPARYGWDDVLLESMEMHDSIHNMRILEQVTPGIIAFDENEGGIMQQYNVPSTSTAEQNYWPIVWDFVTPEANTTQMYESSTLCPFLEPQFGDKEHPLLPTGWKLSAGTEVVNYVRVRSVDRRYNLTDYEYTSFQMIKNTDASALYADHPDVALFRILEDRSSTIEAVQNMTAAASFAHRPLRWWFSANATLDWDKDKSEAVLTGMAYSLRGCDYDTTCTAPMTHPAIDNMHRVTLRSYFGIRNDNTLSWVTPGTK